MLERGARSGARGEKFQIEKCEKDEDFFVVVVLEVEAGNKEVLVQLHCVPFLPISPPLLVSTDPCIAGGLQGLF
jgi:hypothetical protein